MILLKNTDRGIKGRIWRHLFEERHLKEAFSESHRAVMERNADILYFELTDDEYNKLVSEVPII